MCLHVGGQVQRHMCACMWASAEACVWKPEDSLGSCPSGALFFTWFLGIEFLMLPDSTSLTQLFPQAPNYCFDYYKFIQRITEFLFR